MVEDDWMCCRPIIFSWQVIMSMVIAPHTSWTILLTTIVDPTSWGRACYSTGKGWDDWLLLRVLVISMNPGAGTHGGALVLSSGVSTLGLNVASLANLGSGICLHVLGLPSGVFTHWVKIFGTPVFWLKPAGVFAVEGMVSFKHPMPLVGPMVLVLVPWFLPLLCFQRGKDSWVSLDWEGVICTQFEGSTGLNTWASVKVVNDSIHPLNSLMHSASWHISSSRVGLARSAQYWRALAYAKSSEVGSTDSPVSQSLDPLSGGRHHSPDKVEVGGAM